MNLASVCNRSVPTTTADRPLAEAAAKLLQQHVGALAVVNMGRPIGIVTDRDIVCGQVNHTANLHCLTVADVMSHRPLTLPETTAVPEAIDYMSQMGVRRILLVDAAENLSGIVSIDDLLPIVADELAVLARLLRTHPAEPRGASEPVASSAVMAKPSGAGSSVSAPPR